MHSTRSTSTPAPALLVHSGVSPFAVTATLLALYAATGCGSAANGATDARIHPGHGASSIPADNANLGNHGNAYDSTDDLTDPSFVPKPEQLRSPAASDSPLGSTSAALSSSGGTTFQMTYYVISQRPSNDPDDMAISDCDGNFLTMASSAWNDDALMQGTARFIDGNGKSATINAGQGCWVRLPYASRWGLGVQNPATGNAFNLRPFRSIAVDRNVLTVGNWYYIQELDGVTLPSPANGVVHDGCVRAMDVGPAITGSHIDFFSGYYSAYQSLINGSSTVGGLDYVTLMDGADHCAMHVARGY